MKRTWIILLVLAASAAHAAYKCVDERGETHIGDTPPAACANVVMYEVKPGGTVIRRIDPTPTAGEIKARREAEARRKELDRALKQQKRKDDALLNTYASPHEIDVARDRNIEPLQTRIAATKERILAVEKHEKEVSDQIDFYTSGRARNEKEREIPAGLAAERDRARAEKAALAATIAADEREIAELRAKFEADKKRWVDLKSGAAQATDYAKGEPRAPLGKN